MQSRYNFVVWNLDTYTSQHSMEVVFAPRKTQEQWQKNDVWFSFLIVVFDIELENGSVVEWDQECVWSDTVWSRRAGWPVKGLLWVHVKGLFQYVMGGYLRVHMCYLRSWGACRKSFAVGLALFRTRRGWVSRNILRFWLTIICTLVGCS